MPEAVSEALRMIDTFASVGANRIHVTKTDINGVVQWGKPYSPEELRKVLPTMIRVAGKLKECDLLDKKKRKCRRSGEGRGQPHGPGR